MICKICGKKLAEGRRLYCSDKCSKRNYYLRHIEEIKKRNRVWEEKNPEKAKNFHRKAVNKFRKENRERFNKSMLKSYYNNKEKWNARSITAKFVKVHPEIILNKCLRCGNIKDYYLKYEAYPQNIKAVKQAIKDKKIYYLCRECRKLI